VDKFTLESSEEIIQECILAGSAGVKSPTFQKERQKKIARALLPDLEEATAKQIEDEIEQSIDADPYGMAEITGGLEEIPAGDGEAEPPQGPKTPAAAIGAKIQAKMGGQQGGMPQRRGGSQQRASGV
jgi:hypothetical protein